MTPSEIEAALDAGFRECEALGYPLDAEQQQILVQVLTEWVQGQQRTTPETATHNASPSPSDEPNPLNELAPDQRQTLLQFIQAQNRKNRSWKAQLLNDWLRGQDSGAIQFVREQYGLQWLERVQPSHIAQYADEVTMPLQVGDRIEVSNGLWEWVQEEGPCNREWFPCTVIGLREASSSSGSGMGANSRQTNCIIRFDNGMEYEIQGIYEWNRYNWRWGERD